MTLSGKWRNRAADGQPSPIDSTRNIRAIRTIPTQTNSANIANYANVNPDLKLTPYGEFSELLWPEPEPFPLALWSEPWKYACLFALASSYGAGLTKDAGGRLTLACPPTMPQEAIQAARDGLAELAGYIGGRLQ